MTPERIALAERPFERYVRVRNPGDKRAKIVPKSIVEEECGYCQDGMRLCDVIEGGEHRQSEMPCEFYPNGCDGTGRVWREGGVE